MVYFSSSVSLYKIFELNILDDISGSKIKMNDHNVKGMISFDKVSSENCILKFLVTEGKLNIEFIFFFAALCLYISVNVHEIPTLLET